MEELNQIGTEEMIANFQDKTTSVVLPPNVDYLDIPSFLLSTSIAFLNKKPLKGQASYNLFAPQRMTLDALVSHVLAGRAWMPAASEAQTRKVFKSAQVLALDFDNKDDGSLPVSIEALVQHPFIGQYAAFVYATPSSTPARPKSRAVFILDEAICTAEGFTAATIALMDRCSDIGPDAACKDTSRLYYGCKDAAHWTRAAVLPLALLREHAQDMRNRDAATARRLKAAFDAAHREHQGYATKASYEADAIRNPMFYARTTLENNSAAAARANEGTRNKTLFTQAWKTFCVSDAMPGTLSDSEIEAAFWAAGRACGLPDNEIRVTLASAQRYPRVVLRAMQGKRIGPDAPHTPGPKGGQRRAAETSAHTDYSPAGELRYVPLDDDMPAFYDALADIDDTPYIDAYPMLADEDAPPPFWADAQAADRAEELGKSSVKSREKYSKNTSEVHQESASIPTHILQYASEIKGLSEYPHALPDSWMFALEDVRGGQVAGLLNALYGLLHRGQLAPWADSETIKQALTDAGYTFDGNMLSKALSAAVKAQFIEAAPAKVVFPEMQHYKIDMVRESSLCCNLGKTKNARRFYRVLPFDDLGKQLMARVYEALIDDFYPHDAEAYDTARADIMTLEDMRSCLAALKARRLNSLSAPNVWAAIPHHLKAAAKYKGDFEAAQENARRRPAFFGAIRTIPAPATRNGLMALGLDAQAAEAAAAKMNQVSGQGDTHGLIALKWAVMLQSYKHRMAALDDMETTPFSEARLEAKAQMDALRRARVMPHDNRPMTGKAQAERLGVDNRASAVRASKRLGLRREERSERRALEVQRRGDTPVLLDDVRAAIRAAVKKGEYPTQVITFDEYGKLFDSVAIEDLEDLRLGVTFAVQVQMASIIHVEDMPQRAERVKPAQDAQEGQAAEAAAQDASKEAAPRRVHRTRLYTPQWVLHNMIAPRIPQHGGLWVHPETGEVFEDVCSMLYALIDQTPPHEKAQAAEGVKAS